MKYFYVLVTTDYDGYEWLCRDLVQAESQREAEKLVNATDYTHDNGIEVQEIDSVREISKEDYDVLVKYI